MGYNEKEELEATGEWLLRINKAGFAEELHYVPSQLAKLGVAPVDVVDRLDWLRTHNAVKVTAKVEKPLARPVSKEVAVVVPAVAPVMVLYRTEDQEEPEMVLLGELEEELKAPMMELEANLFALNYDSYGPWEWFGKVESMIENAIRSVLDPEPGLYEFNELSSLMRGEEPRLLPQRKGRRKARASVLVG